MRQLELGFISNIFDFKKYFEPMRALKRFCYSDFGEQFHRSF